MTESQPSRLLAVAIAVAGASLALTVAATGASGSARRPTEAVAAGKIGLPKETIGVMGPINAAEIIKLGTDATVAAAKALGWKTVQVFDEKIRIFT